MESEQKKKGGCGARLIVFIGVIAVAFLVVQRISLRGESQFYGRWQMTDESWEAELKYREEKKTYLFYKNISFSGPDVRSPLKARFYAIDEGLTSSKISGNFSSSDDGKHIMSCPEMAKGSWAWCPVRWIDFDTIVVEDNSRRTRTYRRISAKTSGE